MTLGRLLRKRRNVYGFEPRAIPDKSLLGILDDATHVPSAGFTQDFEFIVVKDPIIRKDLAIAGHQPEYMSEGLAKSDFIKGSGHYCSMWKQEEI